MKPQINDDGNNLLDLSDTMTTTTTTTSTSTTAINASENTKILPHQKDNDDDSRLPLSVAKCIAIHLSPQLSDIFNFSLVNKTCHLAVVENDKLWVKQLQTIGLWDRHEAVKLKKRKNTTTTDSQMESNVEAVIANMDPINCFDPTKIIYDPNYAFVQFKAIYSQIYPVFTDLIIVNSSNFASSKFLKFYTDSETQVKLFNNLTQFLKIYEGTESYRGFSIRLNTIIDLFINSVAKELEITFQNKNYKECAKYINIAQELNYSNTTTATTDIVMEFFINTYVENFNFLNSGDEAVSSCFYKKTNKTYIDYEQLSQLFNQTKQILTTEFNEIAKIFTNDPGHEVPIILKIIENFLQNVLINKFIEDLITRASLIDEREEAIEEIVELEIPSIKEEPEVEQEPEPESQSQEQPPVNNNEWADIATSAENNNTTFSTTTTTTTTTAATQLDTKTETEQKKESGIEQLSNAALYFQMVPYLYRKLVDMFATIEYPTSSSSENEKAVDYKKIAIDLIDFHYEPLLSDFIDRLPRQCNLLWEQIVNNWKQNLQQQESSQASQILELVTSDDSKNKNFLKLDIFTGFSKIFKVGNSVNVNEVEAAHHHSNQEQAAASSSHPHNHPKFFTKNEANLKILTANLNNIKSLISLDLAITLLKTLKENTELLLSLTGRTEMKKKNKPLKVGEFAPADNYTNEDVRHLVNMTCQEMFNDMVNILMTMHIQSGFAQALERLKNYRPSDLKQVEGDTTVDPIINFIELVNVGDLIQQMISVFYREELVNTKIVVQKHKTKRDFLMANKCEKSMRKFESMLDNYVADGLNISIDVLMSEVSYVIMSTLQSSDFNISEKDLIDKKIDLGSPSKLGQKLLEILETHVNLLTGSIDKAIVDVFQQEIGERFVNILVKLITKDLIISTTGAVILISDLNSYYNFFLKLKVKPVLAYFVALKSISQLYLIDSENARDIGKLVVKIGRENGIFNQEEIYEFVTRRSDWDRIKKDVDKIMYGLGLAECTVM